MEDDDTFDFSDADTSGEPSDGLAYEPSRKVVVFADMLGFAALTEQHEIDPDVFEEMQRPGAVEFLRASLEQLEANPLAERFVRFHLLVEEAARETRLANDATSITFSDCAFFATETLTSAVDYAVAVMHRALDQRIPVRIGLGCGDFLMVRIRADVGSTNQDHVVQFLGSGVSRACAAERCGIKGLRILLHPSIDVLFAGRRYREHRLNDYYRPIDVTADERENRAGVTKELNYIWHPRHDEKYWNAVQGMRHMSDATEQSHYDSTDSALNRMRMALGRAPFESASEGA